MLRGEFYHKVKKLNSKLIIVAGDFDTFPDGRPTFAGLGYWDEKEGWIGVCAVDRHELPEYTKFDMGAHIIETGWRRPIWALYSKGLATRKKIKEVFGDGFFENRQRDLVPTQLDPVKRILSEKMLKNLDRTGSSGLTNNDIEEVGAVMSKLPSVQASRAKEEEDIWHLKKDPDAYVAKAGQEAAAKAQSSFTSDANAWPTDLNAPVVEVPK